MHLTEQIINNKKRIYYHGSPNDNLSFIKGKNIDDVFSVGFITTDILYAAKYAKKYDDIGYVYRIEFKSPPDIFSAYYLKDLLRWSKKYTLSHNLTDLWSLQEIDWIDSTKIAFKKDRIDTMKCLFDLKYDGFTNHEEKEHHHSIGIFNCENKLIIRDKIDTESLKLKKEVAVEIIQESIEISEKLYNGQIKKLESSRMPDQWIDKSIIKESHSHYIEKQKRWK